MGREHGSVRRGADDADDRDRDTDDGRLEWRFDAVWAMLYDPENPEACIETRTGTVNVRKWR